MSKFVELTLDDDVEPWPIMINLDHIFLIERNHDGGTVLFSSEANIAGGYCRKVSEDYETVKKMIERAQQ